MHSCGFDDAPAVGGRPTANPGGVLQQTELMSVASVCADMPAPMDKEISGH
jgi:hypothetical protein